MDEKVQLAIEDVSYILPGQRAEGIQPGDFILTHGIGTIDSLIRFGQSLRFTGDAAKFAYWNHCALITSPDGDLIEATDQGVCASHLSKYDGTDYIIVKISALDIDRLEATTFATACIGRKYGWTHIVSCGISLLTGLNFSFGFDSQMICSGLVATSLERTSAVFDRDAAHITPADLAKYYNAAVIS